MNTVALTCSLGECSQFDWYQCYDDHRSPLGALVESIDVAEPCSAEGQQPLTIRVRMLGSFRDGRIEVTYTGVNSFSVEASGGSSRNGEGVHGVWLHDKLLRAKHDSLIHEVKLVGGNWRIEASDAVFQWAPL